MMIYDLAISANKMLLWGNLGKDNIAWKEGPYVSSGAGDPDICHDYPYCMKVSSHTERVVYLILGPDPPKDKRGAMRMTDHPQEDMTEHLMAKLSIISQHSLPEAYELDCYTSVLSNHICDLDSERFTLKEIQVKGFETLLKDRVEHYSSKYARQSVEKRVTKYWQKIEHIKQISVKTLEEYVRLSNRRNELVHDLKYVPPGIEEAVDYFYSCRTEEYKKQLK